MLTILFMMSTNISFAEAGAGASKLVVLHRHRGM